MFNTDLFVRFQPDGFGGERNVYDLAELLQLILCGKEVIVEGHKGVITGLRPEAGNKHNGIHCLWLMSMEHTDNLQRMSLPGIPNAAKEIADVSKEFFVVAKKW